MTDLPEPASSEKRDSRTSPSGEPGQTIPESSDSRIDTGAECDIAAHLAKGLARAAIGTSATYPNGRGGVEGWRVWADADGWRWRAWRLTDSTDGRASFRSQAEADAEHEYEVMR